MHRLVDYRVIMCPHIFSQSMGNLIDTRTKATIIPMSNWKAIEKSLHISLCQKIPTNQHLQLSPRKPVRINAISYKEWYAWSPYLSPPRVRIWLSLLWLSLTLACAGLQYLVSVSVCVCLLLNISLFTCCLCHKGY